MQAKLVQSYFDFNSEKSKNTANRPENVFFELSNSSVFNKTMGILRVDVRLVTDDKNHGNYYLDQVLFQKMYSSKIYLQILKSRNC